MNWRTFLIHCAVCGERGARLCATCQNATIRAETLEGLAVTCLGAYEGTLADKIRRLKYRGETALARSLGSGLAELTGAPLSDAHGERQALDLRDEPLPLGSSNEMLLPIPLHPQRLAERGYNQSALVARAMARRTGQGVDFDSLDRVHFAAPQARLRLAERRQNVTAAFQALPARSSESNALWLVDDVMTTGHTLDAAAKALRLTGRQVSGAFCLARKL